ncbi:MAG: putative metal-binding motif-containing protein, partial [Deltaproteobacteria bacterium]|nr:putative metal-binding motif-containing protein [Deltaproteobacteria bacterium]
MLQTDCADADPAIHPGAPEVCNGADDNCNGQMDEGLEERPYYRDQDGDGYGSVQVGAGCALAAEGYSLQAGDCDDLNSARSPAAAEACNAVDDDCDGTVDDGLPVNTFYVDADGDGFGAAGPSVQDCKPSLPGRAPNADD